MEYRDRTVFKNALEEKEYSLKTLQEFYAFKYKYFSVVFNYAGEDIQKTDEIIDEGYNNKRTVNNYQIRYFTTEAENDLLTYAKKVTGGVNPFEAHEGKKG